MSAVRRLRRYVNQKQQRPGLVRRPPPEILNPESKMNTCIRMNVLGLTDECKDL